MKALSLTQPWATLIAIGMKRIETRSWSTRYRGPIAIHALDGGAFLNHDFPLGALVAVASLVYVAMTGEALNYQHRDRTLRLPGGRTWTITPAEYPFGDYSPGRFMWFLDDVRALPEPIPCKGALGLWSVPDDVAELTLRDGRMTALHFTLNCIPPTASHHSKKIVRIGKFSRLADTDRLVAAKETIDVLLLEHRPPAPMTGPVSLTLEFTWPWRASDSKRLRACGRIPRVTRPDCSNLAKTTEDRLVALRFLEDDGQVVELIVRKYFGDRPGIAVTLRPHLATNGMQLISGTVA